MKLFNCLDAQYDSRMEMKSAQIGPNKYLAWNFELPLNDLNNPIFLNIPKMLRVRTLTVNKCDDGDLSYACVANVFVMEYHVLVY